MNGIEQKFNVCSLIGVAEIRVQFYKQGRRYFRVASVTNVDKAHQAVVISDSHMKVPVLDKGVQGYLVYFKKGTDEWCELLPLDDPNKEKRR